VREHHDMDFVVRAVVPGHIVAARVTFSGDKLLGGPQAGIILGRADLVDRIASHPLARAVRADKLTLAALQHVALAYLRGDAARLPLWRMATAPLDGLRSRAETIAGDVPNAKVVESEAVAGGGSLPGLTIPSIGVSVEVDDPDRVLAELHERDVVARIVEDAVLADVRTVDPADDLALAEALRDAVASPASPA
jgi:L-seryl-tRNA(Ser) seleniumtransferase